VAVSPGGSRWPCSPATPTGQDEIRTGRLRTAQ
jgi:hypothetical protein